MLQVGMSFVNCSGIRVPILKLIETRLDYGSIVEH
jgi:hypothetical protein